MASKIALTPDQQRVVDTRNCDLLVAAAAGSGKTAVLVQRIIKQIIEEKRDIDRMLIVTFTRAAAAEMRDRIGKAIEKELAEDPENEHLKKQLLALPGAFITTIDSFCLNVVYSYFYKTDIDPSFRMVDDSELKPIKDEILKDIFKKHYEADDEAFATLLRIFKITECEEALKDAIIKLERCSESQPRPERWILSLKSDVFDTNLLRNEARKRLSSVALSEKYLYEECKAGRAPENYEAFFKVEVETLEAALGKLDSLDYDGIRAVLKEKWNTIPPAKGDKTYAEKIKDQRNANKDAIQKNFANKYLDREYKDIASDMEKMAPYKEILVDLTLEFLAEYKQAKRAAKIADFSDVEHMALEILSEYVCEEGSAAGSERPTDVARMLSDEFDEIMIDEYQDSNDVQETILGSISKRYKGEPDMFMVGDVKQSIYRFRMAKPELFMGKYDTYTTDGTGDQRLIELSKNFRSRKVVLDSINDIFEFVMTKDNCGIEYNEGARLYHGNMDYSEDAPANMSELIVALTPEKSETDTAVEEDDTTKIERQAIIAAGRIHELVSKENGLVIYDKEKKCVRAASYKDIKILVRSMKDIDKVQRVFEELKVPASIESNDGFFDCIEISTILDFLSMIDNPYQDLPTCSVLYSAIGGLNAADLAKVRVCDKQAPLYLAARKYAVLKKDTTEVRYLDTGLQAKLVAFFETFDYLKKKSGILKTSELLQEIYIKTGFYDLVLAMPGGVKKRRNLDMLISLSKKNETGSFSGIADFVDYIRKQKKYSIKQGEAFAGGESPDEVSLGTIHKSKGLEYPVTIILRAEGNYNLMENKDRVVLNPKYGIGMDLVDPVKRTKRKPLEKQLVMDATERDAQEEEMRILYVALTRAKEKLIIIGEMKQSAYEKEIQKENANVLPYTDFRGVKSYMGLMLRAVHKNVVSATPHWIIREFDTTDVIKELSGEILNIEAKKTELEDYARAVDRATTEKGEIYDMLEGNSMSEYAFKDEINIPVKLSVSDLKHRAMEENGITFEEAPALSVIKESESLDQAVADNAVQNEKTALTEMTQDGFRRLSGSERGTLYHYILEKLPLNGDRSASGLEKEFDRLLSENKIDADERHCLKARDFERFYSTAAANRMRKAETEGKLHKESQFMIAVKACEILDTKSEEPVLIQGIIDVWFEENGKAVILDYKTDKVSLTTPDGWKTELSLKYRKQLELYGRAVYQTYGFEPSDMIIYSFGAGDEMIL